MRFITTAISMVLRFKTPLILGGVAIAMASSAWVGYKVAEGVYSEELRDRIAYYEVELAKADERNMELVEEVDKVDVKTEYITREVVKYVEANPDLNDCELDADGLRLWNGETE